MSGFDVMPGSTADAGPDPAADHAHGTRPVAPVPDVEVRRNGVLFAVMALVCLALGLAYVVRGARDGGGLSWVAAVLIAGLGVVMALSWWESKTPMLVADAFGIRIRLGREWRGLPWAALEQVVVEPRTSLLHDGRLVVVPSDEAEALDGLDARGRRQVALSQKVYGAALAVPLGMTTRVSVPRLVDALAELAGTRSAVVELAGYAAEPVVPMAPEHLERREARAQVATTARDGSRMRAARPVEPGSERPRALEGIRMLEDFGHTVRLGVGTGVSNLVALLDRSTGPVSGPVTGPVTGPSNGPAVRSSALDIVMVDGSSALALEPLEDEQEDDGEDDHRLDDRQDDTQDGPTARSSVSVPETDDRDGEWDPSPAPVQDPALLVPVEDQPAIGDRLHRARLLLGHDVRSLAEVTRIQAHVIEGIELDDFGPCGGDFYARGHLRSLCAVLGVPADEVIAVFDARHASAPVDAKRVFGAELATGRPHDRNGRRWATVLVVLLVLVLAWGLARLFTDQPQALSTPTLNGSAGLASQRAPITSVFGAPVNMSVRGVGGTSEVVVRDHTGLVMWTGTLRAGVRQQLTGVGPFQVSADSPDNVEVWVDGKDRGNVVADNAVVGPQTRTFSR